MASTLNTHHSTNVDEASLLFGSSSPTVNLIDLHPQPVHIFRLWQTFLDNVNPLTKIIHAPTMQQLVLEAAGDLEHVPQGLEALMFAIYTFAVTSLSTIECESMFGEAKSTLLAKYRLGTQQALVGAGFLRSSDLVILQAFVLFLVCSPPPPPLYLYRMLTGKLSVRQFYDHRSLWAITGVAVRIGQRLGLHRDGTSLGLSIFESEMRRRLWWQIVILDSRSAALSGSGASVMAHLWDTKPHLNINDSDLSPNMREPPLEHGGLTEMTFCMLRLEIGRFMQHSNSSDAFDGGKHSSSSIAALLVERDKTIDELERVFERKFLRFCDPMIPLHVIIAAVARCAICKLRVVAHHPRQYSEGLKTMPQREKDMLFANCLKMVEEVNIVHSNKSTQRYLWHVKVYFQLEALAYTLSALRQRTTGDVVARAWSQLGQLFEHYPEMLIDRKKALFVAIQNMTIKAWKAREAASTCDNRSHSSTTLKPPRLISILLSHRRPTMTASAAALNMDDCSNIQSRSQLSEQHQINDIYPIDQGLVSDISSNYGLPISSDSFQADLDPMDWASWDEILKGSDLQSFDGSG